MATKYFVKLGALLAVAGLFSIYASVADAVPVGGPPGIPVACGTPAALHNPHCVGGGGGNGGNKGNATGKVLGQIAVGMAICSVVSPMIHIALKGKLTYKQGHGDVVGCFLPFIGPWLLNAHYDRMCQLSRSNPAYRDSSIYCDPPGSGGGNFLFAANGAPAKYATLMKKTKAASAKHGKSQTHANAQRRAVRLAYNFQSGFKAW